MELTDFLHADTNSHKLKGDLKFSVGYGPKWVWSVWSHDSKIDCISKMSRWNKLIFYILVQIQES